MSVWSTVTAADAAALERELERELPAGYVLKTARLRAVARRIDCDDVAFELGDGRYCIVHLTWNVETNARWPRCEFVTSLPENEP
jgi:hypothetical protein